MKKGGKIVLSIIIGNHNTSKILQKTLDSIFTHLKDFAFEVIVIDDASSDNSVTEIKRNYPKVKIICNKKNLGYSKSYNKGTKEARGEYILHLNSDILLKRASNIKSAILYLESHKKVGILGCKIIKHNDELDLPCKRSFPNIMNVFFVTIGLAKLLPQNKLFGNYYLTYLDENEIHNVDCLMGAFMLIKKKVISEIGYLDERFFIYGEDIDFCFRAKKYKWEIVYYPPVIIQHRHGATTVNSKLRHIWLFHYAMWLYYKKHYSQHFILVRLVVFLGICIRLIFIYIFSLLN